MTNVKSQIAKPRVLLGMSGGIDSTVSAMLLLEQGYEVVGVTFRTFDSMKESCLAKEKGCCTIDSIMEAKHNAERMGFDEKPHLVVCLLSHSFCQHLPHTRVCFRCLFSAVRISWKWLWIFLRHLHPEMQIILLV